MKSRNRPHNKKDDSTLTRLVKARIQPQDSEIMQKSTQPRQPSHTPQPELLPAQSFQPPPEESPQLPPEQPPEESPQILRQLPLKQPVAQQLRLVAAPAIQRAPEAAQQYATPHEIMQVKIKQTTDLPRQTFFMRPDQIACVKYWAVVDARGISDIAREAFDYWLNARKNAHVGQQPGDNKDD